MGNCDDFSTETLEYRISLSGIIKSDGILSSDNEKKSWLSHITKSKTIKGSTSLNSDDSDDD